MNEDELQQQPLRASTDAEYDNVAAQMRTDRQTQQDIEQAYAPARPQDSVGKKVASWFSTVLPDRNTVPKYAKAVARGVVNAGRETADTLNSLAEGSGAMQKPDANFVEHWYNKPIIDSRPMTDGEVEGLLGKHEDGVAGFVESVAQFTTGMVAAGEVMKPLQIASKAPVLGRALAGAVSDMTVFDPHQARLSDAVQGSVFANEVTGLLANDKNDSELVARLKAGTEGLITGYTLDKFIGGIKALRALRGAKTEAEKAAALEHLNVEHNPTTQGPAIVKPQEDGTFIVSTPEGERRQLARRKTDGDFIPTKESLTAARKAEPAEIEFFQRRKEWTYEQFKETYPNLTTTKEEWDAVAREIAARPTDNLPYRSAAEAEAVAASTNQAVLNAAQPRGSLTEEQVRMLQEHADKLTAQAIPTWVSPDFNFNYVASPDEVKATIQAISEKLPRPATVQTHAQTVALAEGMFDDMSGEQVVEALRKQNVSMADMPQRIQGARTYLNSTATKVAALSKAADAMPDNAIAFNELKKAMTHLYDIHESVAGMSRSVGRALDAHKIIVGESEADNAVRAATEHLTTVAQKEALDTMQKSELLATARLIRMSEGNPTEILAMMRGQTVLSQAKKSLSRFQQIAEKVNGYRMEAMLSGPRTHFVNTVSNAMAAMQMPVEMWWGGVTSENKAMAQQGTDQLIGLFLESRDAWRAAGKAFRTGLNSLDESGAVVRDAATNAANPLSAVARIAHLPSRLLLTSDEFFKTLNYRSSVRGQSLRLAREQGITDATELAGRVADDMKAAFNLDGGATNPKALEWARTATFQNPLEYGYGKAWQELIVKHPELRLITPFVRTPINLFRYAWQRTPLLGAFQGQMRADLAAGGERAALALSKQQLGIAMYTGAALLAHNKIITGSGPKDPALHRQWLAAGNQPYSVKVPGSGWISYARANPTFQALGIVADLHQMSGEIFQQKHTELAAAWAASIAANITNQTFMQGLSDTLDALSSGDARQMQRLFSNTAGSFVPNVLRQLNPDDTLRETRGMVDELTARLPGFSTFLEPRRNIFGEPIMKPPGYLNQALNPFTYMADVGDDDVQQELLKLGKAMAMPSTTRGTVDLTDRSTYDNGTKQSPYDRWMQLVSKSGAREELTKKVKSPEWSHYSDGTEAFPGGRKFDAAAVILSKHQDRAWQQVLTEYPKLKVALHLVQQEKRAALRSSTSTNSPVQQDAALFR